MSAKEISIRAQAISKSMVERIGKVVTSFGFPQSQADDTMFYKHSENNNRVVMLIVYVDDIILTSNDEAELNMLKKRLASAFQIKDLGTIKYFLGTEFARSKKGMIVNQRK